MQGNRYATDNDSIETEMIQTSVYTQTSILLNPSKHVAQTISKSLKKSHGKLEYLCILIMKRVQAFTFFWSDLNSICERVGRNITSLAFSIKAGTMRLTYSHINEFQGGYYLEFRDVETSD